MKGTDMRVQPIRTELDHAAAVDRISQLMSARPGTAEGDELNTLATLANAWETRHQAVAAPDPITAIQFRMEQQGLTRKDLEPILGSRARVSEVLSRRRSLTLNMIRRLRDSLHLSADVLIQRPSMDSAPQRKRAVRPAASLVSARTRPGSIRNTSA